MSRKYREKKVRALSIWLGILLFILAFGAGVISKGIQPSWAQKYSVVWNDSIGIIQSDISYDDGEANKFDLYLPKDDSRENYGLVIYLHAGGFTSGDKADDAGTLEWLCSKGYVAAGVNYTLRSDTHPEASVLSQSNEIKIAVPKVIEAAESAGYHIDKMTVAGGSAGHALAMIYAYRDGKDAPVPVVFTYGAVGPSSFVAEDWGIFGVGFDTEESRAAGAGLFSVMSGREITPGEIKDGSYREKVHDIAAAEWIPNNPIPTVVAYGAHDRVQPYLASKRLEAALSENDVDYKFFVLEHSGHGLQNDNDVSRQWMEAIDEYLNKYMPVE